MGEVWFAILLAGAGTFAMRASFIAAAHRLAEVPPWASRVLRQIPPAALAAIVLPALVRPEGSIDLLQPRLAAGLLAGLVAWRSRNVLATLVLGIVGLLAFEAIWPGG
jgi:branched-subunit amino acid transport protein